MRHTRNVLCLLALSAALLAGCAQSRATATPVQTSTIDLPPSYKFEPAAIRVSPGTTVTWTNHDNFTHSVQVSGHSDVHMLPPGATTTITFDAPGEYAYVCTLHAQNMRGAVSVT